MSGPNSTQTLEGYGLANASTTQPSYRYPSRDEDLALAEILLSATICVLAIVGNSIVLAVLWRRRKSLSRMHFFIIHLCIADLTVAFLYTLPQTLWDITFRFHAPDAVCRLVKFFQLFPVYLSTYILVMTAVDRYLAICHPLMGLRGNHTRRMRFMVLAAWLIAAVCSAPQFWFFRLTDRAPGAPEPWMDCRANFPKPVTPVVRGYITFFTMAVYVLPSLILAAAYGLICLTVWRNMEKKYKSPDAAKSQRSLMHKEAPTATAAKENNNWEDDETDKMHPEQIELQQSGALKRDNASSQPPLYRRHGAAGKVSRAKVKTVKMTLTIVTVYVVSWAPFFVAQMLSIWASVQFESIFFTICLLLTSLTSCLNPWIYFAFSSNAGRDIKQALCCTPTPRRENGLASDRTHHDETSGRYVCTTATAAASM